MATPPEVDTFSEEEVSEEKKKDRDFYIFIEFSKGGREGGTRPRTLQGDAVDEPVTRLSDRLVRADDVSVSHNERKVPRERIAASGSGHDGDLGRGGHLCQIKTKNKLKKVRKDAQSRSVDGA